MGVIQYRGFEKRRESSGFIFSKFTPYYGRSCKTSKIYCKVGIVIIPISTTEVAAVREKMPDVHITITSKRKKHGGKTYYVEEASRVLRFIDELRKDYKEEHKNG